MTTERPPLTSTETVSADGVIDSVQRVLLPRPIVSFDDAGARHLAWAYMDSINRSTAYLVRVRARNGTVDLALLGAVSLLRFARPELIAAPDRVGGTFAITGGILARGTGGRLSVEQRADPELSLSIAVSGYNARLARRGARLYRSVQSPAHRAVSRRFLQSRARGPRS